MPAQPSRPLAEPALMGELRSVEVVDFLDPAELETDGLIDFGHGYDDEDHAVEFVQEHQDSKEVAQKREEAQAEEDRDEPAKFTAPQTVTNDEYDAVEQLLKQARAAKKSEEKEKMARIKLEKQVRALQTLNDQLRTKNNDMAKEAKEAKAEQDRKLAIANARLQQSKGSENKKKAAELPFG